MQPRHELLYSFCPHKFESSISPVIYFIFFTGDMVKLAFRFAILLFTNKNPLADKMFAILNTAFYTHAWFIIYANQLDWLEYKPCYGWSALK